MPENSVPERPSDPQRDAALVDAAWGQVAALLSPSHTPHPTPPLGPNSALPPIHAIPAAFPGYQVLGEFQRGGQGVVYLAIQESTHRKVAIKVLRQGPFASPSALARFEREVDLLARLRHPGIVAVHDRGIAGGCPFLVMDYVAGRPLDSYVLAAALDTRQTLELFQKICDAVHAAHLVGIIHRDLKPANIRVDDNGEPHVLDFGLAKLAAEPDTTTPDLTETGQFIGSLPWASPEQAEGRHDLTDLRTDVYSLGVLLFHMLTGELPYPPSDTPRQLAAHIVGTTPVRPSSVRRGVGGDVETIILKCIAKDPARRYQSAGELARDVANTLAGNPIDARRDSAAYVLRKALRRHWPAAATGAVFLLFLTGTAVTTTILYRQATHARLESQTRLERAEREALKAAKVGRILGSLLTSMSPWQWAGAENAGVLQSLLDQARVQADAELIDQPDVRAALDEVLGRGYLALSNYPRAEEHLVRCLALRQELLGDDHADVAAAMIPLAALRYAQGRNAEAEALAASALEYHLATLGEASPGAASTLALLAELSLDAGDLDGADQYGRRAAAAFATLYGDTHPQLIGVYHTMGILMRTDGRLDAAEAIFAEALRIGRAALPSDHPLIAASHTHLGGVFTITHDVEKAESHLREALRIRRATYDGPHEETAITLTNLAALHSQRGKYADAESAAREAIDMLRAIGAPDDSHTASALSNLANALQGTGKLDEAADAYGEALALSRGRDDRRAATIMGNIAQLKKAQGDLAAAEAGETEALALRRALYGEVHLEIAHSLHNLGDTVTKLGDPARAEPILRESLAIYRTLMGDRHALVGMSLGVLGRCLLALHAGGDEAAPVLEESVTILSAADPPTSRRLIMNRCELAEALARQQRFEEALTYLLASEAALAGTRALADHADVVGRLIRLYERWDRPDQAALWQAKLANITPP